MKSAEKRPRSIRKTSEGVSTRGSFSGEPVEEVGLDAWHMRSVRDARDKDTGDRSEDIMRVVGEWKAANVTRFEKLVDPDGVLAPEERARRVEHARKAHIARMAMASAKARRIRAQVRQQLAGGEAP